jgi:hypothetical protein
VDTVVEKRTKTVSRQKCTAPETTPDTKTGNTLSRQKKVGNACRGRKTWRGQSIVFLIFFDDFGAAYTAQKICSVRPLFFVFLPLFETNENWAWA